MSANAATVIGLVIVLLMSVGIVYIAWKLKQRKPARPDWAHSGTNRREPIKSEPIRQEEPAPKAAETSEVEPVQQSVPREPEQEEVTDEFVRRLLAGELIAPGTTIDRDIELKNLEFKGDIILDGVIIDGSLDMEGVETPGVISLKGATVKGYVDLNGSTAKAYDLTGADIDGDLYMSGNPKDMIVLKGATISGDLKLNDCSFDCGVDCEGMKLSGKFLSENTTFDGAVILKDAEIKGYLDLEGVNAKGIEATGVSVGESGEMDNISVSGDVIFKHSKFKEHVTLQGAEIEGKTDFYFLAVGTGEEGAEDQFQAEGATFKGGLNLSDAKITSYIDLEEVKASQLCIDRIEVSGNLYLNNSQIKGDFSYEGAVIEGELSLEGAELEPFKGMTVKGGVIF